MVSEKLEEQLLLEEPPPAANTNKINTKITIAPINPANVAKDTSSDNFSHINPLFFYFPKRL